MARRVLPQPPGPVRVSRRPCDNSARTSAISRCRPTKLVRGTGTFTCMAIDLQMIVAQCRVDKSRRRLPPLYLTQRAHEGGVVGGAAAEVLGQVVDRLRVFEAATGEHADDALAFG